MTPTGSSVLTDISKRRKVLEHDVRTIESNISQQSTSLAELQQQQETLYLQLADMYADEAAKEGPVKQTRGLFGKARTLLEQREASRNEIIGQIRDSEQEQQSLEEKAEKLETELNALAAQRNAIQDKVAAALHENPTYKLLAEQEHSLGPRLARDEGELDKEIEGARINTPLLESDQRFMYLLNKGFDGTYKGGSRIIFNIDRRLAEDIQFSDLKRRYEHWQTMPKLMKNDIERRKTEFNGIQSQVDALEDPLEREYGLPEILSQGETAADEREDILDAVKSLVEKIAGYRAQVTAFEQEKDPEYKRVLQQLTALLKDEGIEALKERARKTPDTRDEKLVERIETIEASIAVAGSLIAKAQTRVAELKPKYTAVQDVEQRFKRNGYESEQSRFRDELAIGVILTGVESEELTIDQAMNKISAAHYMVERPVYHSTDYGRRRTTDYGPTVSFPSTPRRSSSPSVFSAPRHSGGGFGFSIGRSGGGGGFHMGGRRG